MYTIKCKDCCKVSARNYVNKPKQDKLGDKKEFKECVSNGHRVVVEKL